MCGGGVECVVGVGKCKCSAGDGGNDDDRNASSEDGAHQVVKELQPRRGVCLLEEALQSPRNGL